MGNDNNKSRREFLSVWKPKFSMEKVKMLTPDGKLVEVDRIVVDKSAKKKASNKDILDWTEANQ